MQVNGLTRSWLPIDPPADTSLCSQVLMGEGSDPTMGLPMPVMQRRDLTASAEAVTQSSPTCLCTLSLHRYFNLQIQSISIICLHIWLCH